MVHDRSTKRSLTTHSTVHLALCIPRATLLQLQWFDLLRGLVLTSSIHSIAIQDDHTFDKHSVQVIGLQPMQRKRNLFMR